MFTLSKKVPTSTDTVYSVIWKAPGEYVPINTDRRISKVRTIGGGVIVQDFGVCRFDRDINLAGVITDKNITTNLEKLHNSTDNECIFDDGVGNRWRVYFAGLTIMQHGKGNYTYTMKLIPLEYIGRW